MKYEDFENTINKFSFPNASFRCWRSWDALMINVQIEIMTKDVFNGQVGPLVNLKMMSEKYLDDITEAEIKDYIHQFLQEMILHELDENLRFDNDRPWYPHGLWSERKHLVRTK